MQSHEALKVDDDVLREIMLRLPIKSIVRSRLVNRQWDSLFSDPDFSHLHTRLHAATAQPSFIILQARSRYFCFNHTRGIFSRYYFNFNVKPKILHSSHGLLLLTCKYPRISDPIQYIVYNPTTRQLRVLPIDTSSETRALCLIYDPLRSPYYKVVFLRSVSPCSWDYILYVYNSQSHTFKQIPLTSPIELSICNGVYWNDRVYWMGAFKVSDYYLDLRDNIAVKRGPALVLPETRYGEMNVNYPMVSNGHFYCVSTYLSLHEKFMIVFELVDDHSGWIEKHRANLMLIFENTIPFYSALAGVMGIYRGGREGDCSVLLHALRKVILYRFSDRSFEVVFEDREFKCAKHHMHQYIESLAPV